MPPILNTFGSESLELLERKEEYPDLYTYRFKPAKPIPFTAGQYVHVRLLNMPSGSRGVRELSFASSPQDEAVQFGIDARSKSDFQEALKALAVGDTIELFKIRDHMTWPSPAPEAVMIAGGVGITPFRSMLRDAQQRALQLATTVVHASSGPFLYADEVKELAGAYHQADRSGLIPLLQGIVSRQPNAHYYVAGSAGFVVGIADELRARGTSSIETDAFLGLME